MIIANLESDLFVLIDRTTLLKIKNAGGTGQNMFAIKESQRSYSSIEGYDYLIGSQKFSSPVTCITTTEGYTFIGLSDGAMIKINGTGGSGHNMFAIEHKDGAYNNLENYNYWIGSQYFSSAVTNAVLIGNYLFIILGNGTLIKINDTGGSGQNMFALKEDRGLYSGIDGYHHWVGSQNFPSRVTCINSVKGYIFIGLSDGCLIKIRGIGGSGQNMFAIRNEHGAYNNIEGYDFLVGSQHFSAMPIGIHETETGILITLDDGRLMKIRGVGGSGQNMFALQENGPYYSGLQGYSYWEGSQNFSTAVTSLSLINDYMYIGLSNGIMIKIYGSGGGGQNMFAIKEESGHYSSFDEYNYFGGSQKFNSLILGIYKISSGMLIVLGGGQIVKIRDLGGTGQNMFAIKEEGDHYVGLSDYIYFEGFQKFDIQELSFPISYLRKIFEKTPLFSSHIEYYTPSIGGIIGATTGLRPNEKERDFIVRHPIDGIRAAYAAIHAKNIANEKHPGEQLDSRADAIRHCLWSAMMSRDLSESEAKIITDNHEWGTPDPKSYDEHNNALGRSIGQDSLFDNNQLLEKCEKAADEGSLHFDGSSHGDEN